MRLHKWHGAACLVLPGQAAGQQPAAQLGKEASEGPEWLLSRDPVPVGQRCGPGLALLAPGSQGPRSCHQLPAVPGSCAAQADHQAGAGAGRGVWVSLDCLCLPGDGSGASPHGSLQNQLGSFY